MCWNRAKNCISPCCDSHMIYRDTFVFGFLAPSENVFTVIYPLIFNACLCVSLFYARKLSCRSQKCIVGQSAQGAGRLTVHEKPRNLSSPQPWMDEWIQEIYLNRWSEHPGKLCPLGGQLFWFYLLECQRRWSFRAREAGMHPDKTLSHLVHKKGTLRSI